MAKTRAVSYTHLDVYKRQRVDGERGDLHLQQIPLVAAVRPRQGGLTDEPVAYTHLDVYKRQDYSPPAGTAEGDDPAYRIAPRRVGSSCLLYTSRCV